MKILQLTKYYPPAPGGIESFVDDLSHAFVAEGHENLVLAHRYEKPEPAEISGPMGRVIRVPSYGKLMYAPVAPAYPLYLRRLLREFKPDTIIVHMPNVSGFWPLLMSIDCPLVVFWHADVIFPKEKFFHTIAYEGYSYFEKALLKKADLIIATSKQYLNCSEPLRPFLEKCSVIPLGIDPNRIPNLSQLEVDEVVRKYFGTSDTRYIFAAGRFAHYKGFDRLVEAVSITRKSYAEVRCLIAGEGETRSLIIKKIREKGLDDFVLCPGYIPADDYWALMKGCDLFCLPSDERTEAFGLVLLEAMSMGRPCISTAIPGSATSWVNKHGETGLVVPPGNAAELAGAISTLLSSDKKRQKMGAAGNYRVANQFLLGVNSKKICGIIKRKIH